MVKVIYDRKGILGSKVHGCHAYRTECLIDIIRVRVNSIGRKYVPHTRTSDEPPWFRPASIKYRKHMDLFGRPMIYNIYIQRIRGFDVYMDKCVRTRKVYCSTCESW